MWQRFKEVLRQARAQAEQTVQAKYSGAALPSNIISAASNPAVAAYREEVFAAFPYTEEAKGWLRDSINFEAQDLRSMRGGGYWDPSRNLVFLYTAQYEAAIHELAHAWWHERRLGQEDAMIEATIRLSAEPDPRYARTQAGVRVHPRHPGAELGGHAGGPQRLGDVRWPRERHDGRPAPRPAVRAPLLRGHVFAAPRRRPLARRARPAPLIDICGQSPTSVRGSSGPLTTRRDTL